MKLPALNKCILPVILLVGFFLRVWGLDFGLPNTFHQDEPIVVNHALAYGTGDLNPHFFAIPPFVSYVLFIVYGVMFLVGKIFGMWVDAEVFALEFFRDPTVFYLAGRFFIGVLPGTLSIFFIYRIAKRFISEQAALYAAAVMAVAFLNVANSHYIYVDALLVMFIILAYDAFFLMQRSPTIRNYCISAVLVGVAVGIKYNAALLALPYLYVHVSLIAKKRIGLGGRFLGMLCAGALSGVVAFLVVNPFVVLDFPGFFSSVMRQAGAFWSTGWSHHFVYSTFEGVSAPLSIAGCFGLLLLLRNSWGRIFVSLPVMLYVVLVFRSQHFSRYALPLVPFLSVGAAYLMLDMPRRWGRTPIIKNATLIVAVLFLIPTFIKTVKADVLFSSEDIRVTAANWIKKNLPVGARIACDSTTYRPALKQPYSQLQEKMNFVDKQEGLGQLKKQKLKLMLATSSKGKGYPLYFLFESPATEGQFLSTLPAISCSQAEIEQNGIDYIIVNGQTNWIKNEKFLAFLAADCEVVAEFSPFSDGRYRETVDKIATTCIPVSDRDLFSRKTTGPPMRLYRIK